MHGLRVHLTGSAAKDCDEPLLASTHSFVRALVAETIARGGGIVVGVGGEPRGDEGEPCIFDWTALEVIADTPDPGAEWPSLRPERFVAVGSQRGIESVPADRATVWERCRQRSDFDLDVAPPGWRMAGIIRDLQLLRGDILVVIGGGAGAEHLAELYQDEGKPVVPLYGELGAYNDDGNGGSRYLYGRAMADVDAFFRLREGAGSAAGRLSSLHLTGDMDATSRARAAVNLLADLRPRPAFYVRLLDPSHADHADVERFFREVVDQVVVKRGFTPRELGRGQPETAFMNVEIFRAIHRAGIVMVDLTGVRPNCTMELGYALARRRRIVISAKEGTVLPFDGDKLPTFMWSPTDPIGDSVRNFAEWFDRYGDLPSIIN